MQVLRRNCPGTRVGMAPTGDCCLPKDDSPEEVEKARQKSLSDYPGYIISNTWWADPVFLGQYPAWAKEKFGDQLYTMTPEEWALVSQPLDFYAYNCYQGTVDIVPDPSKYDAYAYQGSPQTAEHHPQGAVSRQQVLVRAVPPAHPHHRKRLFGPGLRHAGRRGS